MDIARSLVEKLYDALGRGDAAGVQAVLHPDFVGTFAEGMPAGAGVHRGSRSALQDGWWAIGRSYEARAEPEEFIACADGRLLVRGRYHGRRREGGATVDASFMHLWSVDGGLLTELVQLTDTARWPV